MNKRKQSQFISLFTYLALLVQMMVFILTPELMSAGTLQQSLGPLVGTFMYHYQEGY